MAVIDSLKLNDGTILYPKTLTSAIYNEAGTERLDNVLAKSIYADDEIPATPLPRDADTLGGSLASEYAKKTDAQMYKLTKDDGLPLTSVTDGNSLTTPGLYRVISPTTSFPYGYGIVQVYKRYESQIMQHFIKSDDARLYTRYSSDSGVSWSEWRKTAYIEDGIIESGSNANGDYIKFGDGNLICHRRVSSVSVYTEVPLPASYKDNIYNVITNIYIPNTSDRAKGIVVNVGINNPSMINITPTPISGQTISQGLTFLIMTIGRWK